jgi:hypothetical protein
MKRGCHSQLAEAAVMVVEAAVMVVEAAVMVVEAAAVVSVEVGAWVSYPERRSSSSNKCPGQVVR